MAYGFEHPNPNIRGISKEVQNLDFVKSSDAASVRSCVGKPLARTQRMAGHISGPLQKLLGNGPGPKVLNIKPRVPSIRSYLGRIRGQNTKQLTAVEGAPHSPQDKAGPRTP